MSRSVVINANICGIFFEVAPLLIEFEFSLSEETFIRFSLLSALNAARRAFR